MEDLAATLSSLTDLDSLGKSLEELLEDKFRNVLERTRMKREITSLSFITPTIDLTYTVFAWGEYLAYKEQQLIQTQNGDVEFVVPEIFEYLTQCTTCSVLPLIDFTPSPGGALPSIGDPMMNSLIGSGVDVDLCTAQNKER